MSDPQSKDLKPCPKCGGDHGSEEHFLGGFWVRCTDKQCGYFTRPTVETAEMARAIWNRDRVLVKKFWKRKKKL